MQPDIQALQAAINALQAQRALLGDAVVDAAVAPLKARIDLLSRAAQQLRLVSVLFLDITGSTSLTQHLDPEDVHEVMDGALSRFASLVEEHGGRVLQFAGDSLLAAFGRDGAREDDAERAVRTGLALLEAGRDEGRRVQARFGHTGFDVRVGVHTGMVLLGGGVDEDGSIRGMTVNLAARMEQTAPAGALRISHDTWRHVQGLFEVQAQPPLVVKGRDAPVTTYLVQRALPPGQARPARGVEGLATPLLGREAELARLLAAMEAVRREGRARGCTVLAEAGLGKSRLLDELLQLVDVRATTLQGPPRMVARAHAASQGQPYFVLRELLANWLQITDSETADSARLRFSAGLEPYFAGQGEAPVHLLGQLIGLDFSGSPHLVAVDPRQLRDRALAAFDQLLQALAAERGEPVLLVADDLHWADEASLDALLQWMGAPLPVLVLGLARPALLERRPAWAEGIAGHERLLLDALGPADSQALAAALLHRLPQAPPALTELLIKQSAGNPYYMEELLKMLIDDGVVAIEGPAWTVHAERLAAARVPSTLTGVLQARLDALAVAERHALQQASIVGSVFWDDALAALDPLAPSALPALQGKALVQRREGSAFEDTAEEAFRHHLLHQVAYETVLKAERRAGHAAAARWLAARVNDRSGEHLATTAQHFLQAGDSAQAARWLADAAEHAALRFDNRTALAHAQQALQHAPAADLPLRWRVLLCAFKAADLQADREAQAQMVDGLMALSAMPQVPGGWLARAYYARALLRVRTGLFDEALPDIEQAVVGAEAAGDAEIGAQGHNLGLAALRFRGDADGARVHALAGLAITRANGDQLMLAHIRLLTNLGLLEHDAGRYEQARRHLADCLVLARQHHQIEIQALLLSNLSAAELGLADYASALDWAEQAHALGLQVGDRMQTTLAQINRGHALHGLHQLGEARDALEQAHEVLQTTGSPVYLANLLCIRGDLQLVLGELALAASSFERAHELLQSVGQADEALYGLAGQACALQCQGEVARAMRVLQPVLEALDGTPAAPPTLLQAERLAGLRWLGHQVLAAAGDARAGHWLAAAHEAIQSAALQVSDPASRERFLRDAVEARAIEPAWRAWGGTSG